MSIINGKQKNRVSIKVDGPSGLKFKLFLAYPVLRLAHRVDLPPVGVVLAIQHDVTVPTKLGADEYSLTWEWNEQARSVIDAWASNLFDVGFAYDTGSLELLDVSLIPKVPR